ncbi:alpha-keto-acid decarboxylase domain protein [Mycobacterium xenopi 3993]|nr:alpha-keto-acid decarboxylase domain protein [Mycobacterium xenopi 3993]
MIVLVNNDGYTIERAIHGKNACYNDIVSWNWLQVPRALGVTNALTFRAQTYGELDDAFTAAAQHQDRMVFIEVVVPRFDVPDLLAELAGPPLRTAAPAAELLRLSLLCFASGA